MKRFFRALFWSGNPKAGIFAAMTVVTTLFVIGAPVLFYLAFLHPFEGDGEKIMERFVSIGKGMVCVAVLCAFYFLLLTLLYAARMLRETFPRLPAWLAVLLAMVTLPVFPLVLLACAIQTKCKKTCAWVGFLLCAGAIVWAVQSLFADSHAKALAVQIVSIAGGAALIAAIRSMPVCKRPGRWVFTPVVLLAAGLVFLEITDHVLLRRADKLERDVMASAGVKRTLADVIMDHTNGVPRNVEPYATILSTPFVDVDSEFLRGIPNNTLGSIPAEKLAAYTAFAATNAALLALIDNLTAQPGGKPADDLPAFETWHDYGRLLWPDYVSEGFGWTRHYRNKIVFDTHHNDMPAVMDSLRRIENIAGWFHHGGFGTLLIGEAVEGIRRAGISYAVTRLPESDLVELRQGVEKSLAGMDARARRHLVDETLCMLAMNEALRRVQDETMELSNLKNAHQMLSIWLSCERITLLRVMSDYFALLNNAGPRGLDGEKSAREKTQWHDSIRLPLAAGYRSMGHFAREILRCKDSRLVTLAGLAVERYRRAHGAPPETLADLVPEFLDDIPISFVNGQPLGYKSGEFETPPYHDFDAPTRTVNGYEVYSHPLEGKWTGSTVFTVELE